MDSYLALCPYIRTAWNCYCGAPWQVPERVIYDYELLYIKEGSVRITIEDDAFDAGPGSIFLFKPGKRHSISLRDCTRLHQPHIHFDLIADDLSEQIRVNFQNRAAMTKQEIDMIRRDITAPGTDMEMPDQISVSNLLEFEHYFFDVINTYTTREPFYQVEAKSKFLALWAYLLREVRIMQNTSLSPVAKEYEEVKRYLDENIEHAVTLEELTEHFHISKFHLLRVFKRIYGVTPMNYARMVRINKAKEYISFTSMSITQIAEQLGFSSTNAFSRTFAKEEGVPPTFYRSASRPADGDAALSSCPAKAEKADVKSASPE